MDGHDEIAPEGILAWLSARRDGLSLPAALARNLAMYLSTTLHIESVEGAQGLGVDAFVLSVEALEMFDDEAPPALLALARVWFLKRQVGGINLADRMEAAEGGNAAGLGRGAGAGGNPEGNVFANMTYSHLLLLKVSSRRSHSRLRRVSVAPPWMHAT